MKEDEVKQFLRYFRIKCRAIYLINPDDDDIRDLDKLIK